jgi:hypothetical protein
MEELISKPDYPLVTEVEPIGDHKLRLTFEYGEQRLLDMRPYMIGVFTELKNPDYFRQVRIEDGSIAWPHGQDLAYDMLYHESKQLAVK